jgi:hypothetical protein
VQLLEFIWRGGEDLHLPTQYEKYKPCISRNMFAF